MELSQEAGLKTIVAGQKYPGLNHTRNHVIDRCRSSTRQLARARGQMMIEAKRKSDPIDFLERLNESRLL